MVAYETVAFATILTKEVLSMKSMNVISRCQSAYRAKMLPGDLCPCHHSLILSLCHHPGCSQDELAQDLCLNKSTVARALSQLEEKNYVLRSPDPSDKRRIIVQPTEQMLAILPEVKEIALRWNEEISSGIPEEELAVFRSVLLKMEENARNLVQKGDFAEK